MIRINSDRYIAFVMALGIVIGADAATVRVTGGSWYLGNKLTATNFLLGSTATMSGHGEVRAPATLAGAVSPGNSTEDVGNLSFSDRVAFDSGSFVCHAATATSLDRISATGNVTGAATVYMTRSTSVLPIRQIIIKGGASSDYTLFGVSPASEWVLGETNALDLIVSVIQIPPAPQNIVASDGTYVDKVALSWSTASEATGYQVWRHTANDSSAATLIGTAVQANYYDVNPAVGMLYYYWVKATNIVGASAFSSYDSGWRASMSAGVCADYDGDGKADPAIYDEATGTWRIRLSSDNYSLVVTTLSGLGGRGMASVTADYDGDNKADPAVYQETTGRWAILLSSENYEVLVVLTQPLGGPGYSGMPADYDGDDKAGPGVYQRERGDWKMLLSSDNYNSIELLAFLGGTGYRAVAADYDGDGKADPAIYGESNGYWIFKLSSIEYIEAALTQPLGGTGYIPVPADYDGDGLADPAVKSESGNEWIIMFSLGDYTPVYLTILFE